MTERKLLAALLAVLLCALLLPAAAMAAETSSGLQAFTPAATYADGVFPDVAADAWYASGVKTVYELNIMNGTDLGFEPSGTVTWAQAVTIAARIHAIYHSLDIPEAGGPWYAKYLFYADQRHLLPETCPEMADVNDTSITRQELAMLFRNVLSDADLPVINDAAATDIDAVDARFRNAVTDMYASGIFTGKEGGRFDPEGKTTRAEIAVVITRLLRPAQRVSHDSRANQAMVNQYGNFLMGGNAVYTDGVVYYVIMEGCRDNDDKYTKVSSIMARTDDGECRTVYVSDNIRLGRLSLGEDGMLYVIDNQTDLVRIDPASGRTEKLYTAPYLVAYTLYDGEIYIGEKSNKALEQNGYYRIGRLKNGSLEILSDRMKGDALYMDDSFYCFGGKLYYVFSDGRFCLWSLDLSSRRTEKTIDVRDASISVSDVAYDGATAWFYGGTAGNGYHASLKRINLLLPDLQEDVCKIPDGCGAFYQSLYCNDGQLYYQASGVQGLWAVSPSGEFTHLVTLDGIGVECSFITPQGICTPALSSIYMVSNEQISVYTPQGEKFSLLQFLSRPYLLLGPSELVPAEGTEQTADPEPFDEVFDTGITRSFRTERGDYVAEITVVNKSDEEFGVRSISMYLSQKDLRLRPQRLAAAVPAKSTRVYTFVFPAEVLGPATQADFDAVYFHLWG